MDDRTPPPAFNAIADSITVSGISKCYRKSAAFSPWQHLMARFGRNGVPVKRSREIWALKNVSFSVKPGTILGIIGPNGAGKTTLLKVLARITPPTEGRVVGRGLVAPLLELGTGLQPDLTARQNIVLYAAWHGMSRDEVEKRMDDIVAFAEIQEFLDSQLKHFSSGMYVRLAFSIALNIKPDILLADEVLAVGDIAFQERCMQRVEEAGAAGMTVFFVSHDMAAIQRLCHRVIWINAGEIVKDGDPAAVVSEYEQAAWTITAGSAKRGKKGSHACPHGEILSLRLLSKDGREIGAARRDQPLYLTLTYSVLTPGVLVRCSMAISTRGILAFRAIQPEELEVAANGIFRATVCLPPHLLADTIYTVKAGLYIYKDGQETQLVIDKALSFRVYADDQQSARGLLARGIYRGSDWSGAVMPRLDWTVTRERDVVTARP